MSVAAGPLPNAEMEAQLDDMFDVLLAALAHASPAVILRLVVLWISKLSGMEAAVLATHVDASGDTKAARKMMDRDRTTSRREKRKKAKRAKAAAANPDLSEKMRNGDLSEEQMNNIADAVDEDPDAAIDEELIDQVANADPDQGRKITKEWLDDRKKTDDVNAEYKRQRKVRAVRKSYDPVKRVHTVIVEGDKASIDQIMATFEHKANLLYERDGGRGVPYGQHPRSAAQRLFDAAHHHITGLGDQPDTDADSSAHDGDGDEAPGSDNANPNRTGDSGANTSPSSADTDSKRSDTSCSCSASRRPTGGRPAAVLNIPWERLTNNLDMPVTVPGQGPIPDDVVLRLLNNSDLYVQLTSENTTNGISSQPLWLGRLKRHATINQYIALAIRDGGCVLCDAPPERCHAHHVMPWHAPGEGQTNIDELALLCGPCHRRLHNQNHTLYRDVAKNMWATRPATPRETPPPRPTTRNQEQGNRSYQSRARARTMTWAGGPNAPPGGQS